MRRRISALLLFIFLGLSVALSAQADTLPNSICYLYDHSDDQYGRIIDFKNITRKKVDLKDINLLYIELVSADTYGNNGMFGPFSDKINSKLLKKMSKKYPYKFDSYPNEFKHKGTDFFINQGYNYRLVIVSTVGQVNSFEHNVSKRYFAVGIEDLRTNKVYITTNYTAHSLYVKKFIKSLKD